MERTARDISPAKVVVEIVGCRISASSDTLLSLEVSINIG